MQDERKKVQLLQQGTGKVDLAGDLSVGGKGDEAHLQRAYDLQ